MLLAIGGLAIVLILPDVGALLAFMLNQVRISQERMLHTELFPYFLIPSGLAAFWGFNIYYAIGSALLPLGILCGAGLTIFALISAIWLAWRSSSKIDEQSGGRSAEQGGDIGSRTAGGDNR